MSLVKKYIEEHQKNTLYRLCLKKEEGNIPFHLRSEYLSGLEQHLPKQMALGTLSIPIPLLRELFQNDVGFWQDLAQVITMPENHIYLSYLFSHGNGLNRLGLLGDPNVPDVFTFTLLNKIRDSLLDDFAHSFVSADFQKLEKHAMMLMNRCVELCIPYLQETQENLVWNAFDNEVSVWAQQGKVFKGFSDASAEWMAFMEKKKIAGLKEAFSIVLYQRADESTRDEFRQYYLNNQHFADSVRNRAEVWRAHDLVGLLDSLKTENAFKTVFSNRFK